MDTLISQLENIDVPDSDVHREELKNAVDKLQLRLRSSKDILLELFTHVSIFLIYLFVRYTDWLKHLHTALIRIGVELGLFKHLADKEESLSVDLLAEELGASNGLLGSFYAVIYFITILTGKFESFAYSHPQTLSIKLDHVSSVQTRRPIFSPVQ